MADGPNYEQLFRNGQLTWKTNQPQKDMLERFYAFYKNTSDIDVFRTKYPDFLEELAKADAPAEIVVEQPEAPAKKKRGRPSKSSPSTDEQ